MPLLSLWAWATIQSMTDYEDLGPIMMQHPATDKILLLLLLLLLSICFLLSMFGVIRWIIKRILIHQISCRVAVTWTWIKRSNGWLAEKEKTTFLTFWSISCSASIVPVELFYRPIAYLCAKNGALEPSNNKNRGLRQMQQKLQATIIEAWFTRTRNFSPERLFKSFQDYKDFECRRTFPLLIYFFTGYQGLLWT